MAFNGFFKRKKVPTNSMVSMLSMGISSEEPNNVSKLSNGVPSTGESCPTSMSRPSARSASISTISGLHSHRNVKPMHQMLLAESMFDHSFPLNIKCRLNPSLEQILSDDNIFPYFIQFMESLGSVSKHLIRFWIQTDCLIVSQRNVHLNTDSSEECLKSFRQQFINDSIGIYDKYLSESSVYSIDIPQEIKNEIKEKLSTKRCEISEDLFRKCQDFVIERIEREFYKSFVRSSYYYKYEIDLLTGDSVGLADILFNNSCLATNFMEFMETEGMKAYIDFLIMFENYRKVSNDYDDAIALFNRFFSSDNTSNRLVFSDSLVSTLSEKLIKNNFSEDCLDRAAAILIQYFEKTYLKQFIESQHFVEYLNYCFQVIQTEVNTRTTLKTHKRTNSDSSYNSDSSFVSSIGAREADSTGSGAPFGHRSSHLSEEQKCDSLWKRDLSGKLQFSYVDKYGRISSALEPEPDRSSSGALHKVMKKFSLHSSADKDKEEIAWIIAKKIVNDISNVCNGSNDSLESSHTHT